MVTGYLRRQPRSPAVILALGASPGNPREHAISLSRGISPWASGLSQGRRYRGATGNLVILRVCDFFHLFTH